jgi:hypothetical protein
VSESWSYKLYGPKDLGRKNQIINALERNASRIKRFRKPERSDVDEVLLMLFQYDGSDSVPVSSLLMIIFVPLNSN